MGNFDKLQSKAEKLGIPTNSGIYKPKTEAWQEIQITEYELQRRIKEEERHIREHSMWQYAFWSALASVISAIVALSALLIKG
jgi:hypothetical protein